MRKFFLFLIILFPYLSLSQSSIKIPATIDLKQFTHIAFVDLKDKKLLGRQTYKLYEREFVVTPFKIINPFELDGKLAQRDRFFLQKIKNKKWLYLYYNRDYAPGKSEIITEITLKNYDDEILYSASHYDMTVMETLFELNKFIK